MVERLAAERAAPGDAAASPRRGHAVTVSSSPLSSQPGGDSLKNGNWALPSGSLTSSLVTSSSGRPGGGLDDRGSGIAISAAALSCGRWAERRAGRAPCRTASDPAIVHERATGR